jgi:hypothetical protein
MSETYRPHRVGDMRGQGLNAHIFVLTSGSQQDYCPAVARIRSRRPSAIRAAVVPRWRPGRRQPSLGLPSAACRPRHQDPGRAGRRVMLPQRARSAPGVRRGAQKAHSGDNVARGRRELAPCPGCRLRPAGAGPRCARAPCRHTTLHDPCAGRMKAPLTACPGAKGQCRNCLASTAARGCAARVKGPKSRAFAQFSGLTASVHDPGSSGPASSTSRERCPIRTGMRHLGRLPLRYFPAVLAARVFELCF